jgi:hypothetical protein
MVRRGTVTDNVFKHCKTSGEVITKDAVNETLVEKVRKEVKMQLARKIQCAFKRVWMFVCMFI